MPYIEKYRRMKMDWIARFMSNHIEVDGDLNYLLFAFCKRYIKPSYNNYKNFIGELNETVAEIRRRILAPYEDQKIEENGDVDG